MLRLCRTQLLALLLSAGAAPQASAQIVPNRPAPPLPPAALARIDRAFAEWSGTGAPGCVVGAEQDGRRLFTRAYGMANLEYGVPISAQTVFEAGSISKQFTAAAVLLLAEEGRLRLGDDVRAHVPELPAYSDTVTIGHLLNHTSGLRDWGTVVFYGGWPRGDRVYTNAIALGVIVRQPALNQPPGTYFSYTNSGYVLLAEIVERVTKTSLAAFTRERFFEPLGMRSTRWRTDYRDVVPGRATAYARAGERFVQEMPFENTYGHAGLLTTVDDLLRWNRALQQQRVGREVAAALARPERLANGPALPYGHGLWVGRYRGTPELSHGGATAGYRGWLGRYPAHGVSVALLCNGPANDVGLGRLVADELLPDAAEPVPRALGGVALAPERARAMAGVFESEQTGKPFTVTAERDSLQISGEPAVALASGRFRISWGDFAFEGTDRLHLYDVDGTLFESYRRVSGPLPLPEEMAALAGTYHSDETLASYHVAVENGQLAIRVADRPQFVLLHRPVGPDAFRSTGTIVRVWRDPAGRVESLTLSTTRLRGLRLLRVR